jgi:predicted ATPase
LINTIGLANVLAFQSVVVEARPLTLLSGTNSAGKSSLLHALALLRQSDTARTLPESLLLNGELVQIGTGRDVLHSEPVELDGIDGVALRITLGTDEATQDWVAAYAVDADVLRLTAAPPVARAGGLFHSGFQYLSADRIVPSVTYPKSHELVTVRRFLGVSGEYTPNYLGVHGDEPIDCVAAAHPHATSRTLLDQTNAWLDVLSPGTSLRVDDVEGTDLVRLIYERAGPQVKTEPHRATNVGFGLTYAFPVVVACLAAAPGSLLLIENPEAHLHPNGQAVLGHLCALAAAGGAQVVVETHSDHVLNAIRLAVKRRDLAADDVAVHFFTRTSGVLQPNLTTLAIGSDGMIAAWPSGFFDEWDRALDELLG